jgi:hypothetical protein
MIPCIAVCTPGIMFNFIGETRPPSIGQHRKCSADVDMWFSNPCAYTISLYWCSYEFLNTDVTWRSLSGGACGGFERVNPLHPFAHKSLSPFTTLHPSQPQPKLTRALHKSHLSLFLIQTHNFALSFETLKIASLDL